MAGDHKLVEQGDITMQLDFKRTADYKDWLKELKQKFRSAQIKAAVKVNQELIKFYWELGQDIVEKQKIRKWGDGFISQLSRDLISEFPNIKGFSRRNLEYISRWFSFYTQKNLIAQQAVAQLYPNPEIWMRPYFTYKKPLKTAGQDPC